MTAARFETFERHLQRQPPADFDPTTRTWLARAPGRLDVMGGIADYSGSLVCEMPLSRACYAAIQRRSDEQITIESRPLHESSEGDGELADWHQRLALDVAGCWPGGRPIEPDRVPDDWPGWLRYPLGVYWALCDAGHLSQSDGGFSLVLASDVPAGAGVSSSASVEVATLQALAAAFDIQLGAMERAQLCQRAENRVVGAPCGIMDQVTSVLGEPDRLLKLRCQPHSVEGFIDLPAGLRFVGLDSGVKHSVGGRKYVDARVGAFMGHKIIVGLLQAQHKLPPTSDPTDGYLARLTPEQFVSDFRDALPTKIAGSAYLRKHGETLDGVTRVDPKRTYRVRSRTEHHIYENQRVQQFAELMEQAARNTASLGGSGSLGFDESAIRRAGELMYASHWSYGQRCGLGCVETEFIVSKLREEGEAAGIFGAKITGGGSGGTVAILCRDDNRAMEAIETVAGLYMNKFGNTTTLFTDSGPGALASGVKAWSAS